MAPFRFAERMLKGEPIPVYNNGEMIRDFTYIDDIGEGVLRVSDSQTRPRGGMRSTISAVGNKYRSWILLPP